MRTDTEQLRAAHAILSEVIVSSGVPAGLRRLAAQWCQARQDIARHREAIADSDATRIDIEIQACAEEHEARRRRREGHS